MAVTRSYQELILDLLAPLNPVARRMFGGVGLFQSGAMFGLLVRDTFHLRVDDTTRGRFEAAGSRPFSYNRSGREVSLSAYYVVPDELMDQPDELLEWAREAVTVAASVRKPARRSRRA